MKWKKKQQYAENLRAEKKIKKQYARYPINTKLQPSYRTSVEQ